MNSHTFQIRTLTLTAGLLALVACKSKSKGGNNDAEIAARNAQQKAILVQLVDAVVVPTYQDLATKSAALKVAMDAFATTPSDVTLQTARAAWTAARIPWQKSEAFTFGPVVDDTYGTQLDFWPIDRPALALAITANSTTPVDIIEQEASLKGFHSIEFLYWGADGAKVFSAVTNPEVLYLNQLSNDQARLTKAIADAWTTGESPYASLLKTAGDAGNPAFPSTQEGIDSVFGAWVAMVDAVGNQKIAGPYNSGESEDVESQFSASSIADFQNNLRGVHDVYFGSLTDVAAPASFSAYVAARSPDLDARVKAALTAATTAVAAIPEPFRDSIKAAPAAPQIEAAIESINSLQNLMDDEVRALISP